jgi:hypothetical protein
MRFEPNAGTRVPQQTVIVIIDLELLRFAEWSQRIVLYSIFDTAFLPGAANDGHGPHRD